MMIMDSSTVTDDNTDGFESILRQSWQAFSTMRRFVTEANRLENASWRLWHMQRRHHQIRKNAPATTTVSNPKSTHLASSKKSCVYCEISVATLSCVGCCHDSYCIPCFSLVHQKGHLATHTANVIKPPPSPSSSSSSSSSSLSSLSIPEDQQGVVVEESSYIKPWELQMDALIKGLMENSLHSDGDISIRNIGTAAAVEVCGGSTTSSTTKKSSKRKNSSTSTTTCANCKGPHMTIDCPELEQPLPNTSCSTSIVGLRKSFTAIHNSHSGNSTHAFLGDDMSIRGGKSSSSLFLGEDKSKRGGKVFTMLKEIEEEDNTLKTPIITSVLIPTSSKSTAWVQSSVIYAQQSNGFSSSEEGGDEFIVLCKSTRCSSSDWVQRRIVVSRNTIREYRDDNTSSSAVIGFCNLSNATLVKEKDIIKLHCDCEQDLTIIYFKEDCDNFYQKLECAINLRLDDLFDLNPPPIAGKNSSNELGKGRFSVVRRVLNVKRKEHVALKIIDKTAFEKLVLNETEREDTIVREVMLQSLLSNTTNSNNMIVKLLSVFETREMLILELELMEGGDLFELLSNTIKNNDNNLSQKTVATLVSKLLQSIRYCQKYGVAHRDIKLSNLALKQQQQHEDDNMFTDLRIMDFGMAALRDKESMTLSGRCGTPGYVAPEILVARKHEAYHFNVDVFSAGVVLYTLLCGYEPFYGVTDAELVSANKAAIVEFYEEDWKDVCEDAKDLVRRMLERDPMVRISAEEALKHPFLSSSSSA